MRVFVINAGVKRPDGSGGWLNAEMTRMAKEAFERRKIESIITDLNEKWDLEKEVEKSSRFRFAAGSDTYMGHVHALAVYEMARHCPYRFACLRYRWADTKGSKQALRYGRFSYEKALLDKYNMERSRGRRVRTRTIL